MDEPTALSPPSSSRSLEDWLRELGPLPHDHAMELMAAISDALVKAIEKKGGHTPLSPQTIRVAALDTQAPVVTLLETEGTVDMSDGADVYSLGVVAFEVMVGRPPRLDESLAQALPDVPPSIDRLVGKLLQRSANERPSVVTARRQFLELAGNYENSVRAASVLSAPPLIKRGPPIGELRTDSKAWALQDEGTLLVPPSPRPDQSNPFADDEATATVKGLASPDEETQYTRRSGPELSATVRKPGFRDGERVPLPPPVPTPSDVQRAEVTNPGREGTATAAAEPEAFEATKGDLMGRSHTPMAPMAKAAPRKVPRKPTTPLEQLVAAAMRQPPWIWGALGVGLAFVILLLIGLTR
jgi:serine/threonine protein kinase